MEPQTQQLTRRQLQVVAFLREFLAANDQIPPMHVISERFGWRSANAAQQHIDALSRKGLLERNDIGNWRFARVKQKEGTQCMPYVK